MIKVTKIELVGLVVKIEVERTIVFPLTETIVIEIDKAMLSKLVMLALEV